MQGLAQLSQPIRIMEVIPIGITKGTNRNPSKIGEITLMNPATCLLLDLKITFLANQLGYPYFRGFSLFSNSSVVTYLHSDSMTVHLGGGGNYMSSSGHLQLEMVENMRRYSLMGYCYNEEQRSGSRYVSGGAISVDGLVISFKPLVAEYIDNS